jgi:hypothetical protein
MFGAGDVPPKRQAPVIGENIKQGKGVGIGLQDSGMVSATFNWPEPC